MLKQLFELLYVIIFQPSKAWNMLTQTKDTNDEAFLKTYLYPLFGIIALLTFLGGFVADKEFILEIALKRAISITVTLFLGFYLASFLMSELMVRMFQQNKQTKLCQQFVGYSSAPIYALYMVMAVLPDFFFLKIIIFYAIYIIWEGSDLYFNMDENKKLNFTIFASLIILISPSLIEIIMFLIMPGLRN